MNSVKTAIFIILLFSSAFSFASTKTRVIVTTDGEADDRCSMVRFLLHSDDFQIEGIINSSSQFHWQGGTGWNAYHPVSWVKDYIELYSQVYDNLILHDPDFPAPEYLMSKWKVGNINGIGEMDIRTEGAIHIANVLLDETNNRPIWLQAWGGCNTIARALKIIQEDHPEKMAMVAKKIRLFLIWKQDETYQDYIRPNWEQFEITTIISDQFDCMTYIWNKVLPTNVQLYFNSEAMSQIISQHGPLCNAYENNSGAFNAEGDSPAFLHCIANGLRSIESPDYGGWGGRYIKIRKNVWMDPKPDTDFSYPAGRWTINNSWSKQLENRTDEYGIEIRTKYFKPIWRWMPYIQNDFFARADWCIKPYNQANHHPRVTFNHNNNINAKPGEQISLSVNASDPDNNKLTYKWWVYSEASSYKGNIHIINENTPKVSTSIPQDIKEGETIHIICEVNDNGLPSLTKFQRVIIAISNE